MRKCLTRWFGDEGIRLFFEKSEQAVVVKIDVCFLQNMGFSIKQNFAWSPGALGQKTSTMWGLQKIHAKHGLKSICVEDHCRLNNCGFSTRDHNVCSTLSPDCLTIANLDGYGILGDHCTCGDKFPSNDGHGCT